MRRALRVQHYALWMEDSYLHWVERFLDWVEGGGGCVRKQGHPEPMHVSVQAGQADEAGAGEEQLDSSCSCCAGRRQISARIGALTKAQVNGAIKQHLDPEKMVLVKAGTVPGAK